MKRRPSQPILNPAPESTTKDAPDGGASQPRVAISVTLPPGTYSIRCPASLQLPGATDPAPDPLTQTFRYSRLLIAKVAGRLAATAAVWNPREAARKAIELLDACHEEIKATNYQETVKALQAAGFPTESKDLPFDDAISRLTGKRIPEEAALDFRNFVAFCIRKERSEKVARQSLGRTEVITYEASGKEFPWRQHFQGVSEPTESEITEGVEKIKSIGGIPEGLMEFHEGRVRVWRAYRKATTPPAPGKKRGRPKKT